MTSVGWEMAQRGLQIGIGVLFAVLVPRLMGPEVFGQYALVTAPSRSLSVSAIRSSACEWRSAQNPGRFVRW